MKKQKIQIVIGLLGLILIGLIVSVGLRREIGQPTKEDTQLSGIVI